MQINSIINSQLLINSPLEQFEVTSLDLEINILDINILNNIETYLLGNNLLFIILSVFSLYLFASRAGQRILEGAISGAIAGVIIETGKHLLNGNSSSAPQNGNSSSAPQNNDGSNKSDNNNKSNNNNNTNKK
jgi:hypothetical protein